MTFNKKLLELLKEDARFIDDDGELLIAAVQDRAWKIDHDLIRLLLTDKEIKEKFFVQIEEHWIFNVNTFIDFISHKNFLDDSYTRFKNRIGLTIGNKYLRERGEVALVWPYKDCVLEGGQTKEEEKRKEIFFNQILAQDEINRLFDPKVLTNFKRYNEKGEEKVKDFKRDDNGVIRENLIIRGNNLLVLHTIKNLFREQVKTIYIDPPYNTGNDEFGYNDNFNHASWLTFMKNRLEVAKQLLSQDGAIFVSIDHNEIAYTLQLLDEVFGKESSQNLITIKRGSVTGHKTINPGVVNLAEYVVIYTKNKSLWKPNRVFRERERNTRYNNFIQNREHDISKWQFCSLLDAFSQEIGIPKSKVKKQLGDGFEDQIFEFVIRNAEAVIQYAYPDSGKVSSEVRNLILESKKTPGKVFHKEREGEPDIYLINGQRILFYSDRLIEIDGETVTGELISDIWTDVLPNDLHNEGGVKLKKGKKPEKLLQRIFELGTDPGDLVLDFFLGSGTSAGVAHKMGRQYIGIEQLEYGDNDSINRLNNAIAGEQSGVSKSLRWGGGGILFTVN